MNFKVATAGDAVVLAIPQPRIVRGLRPPRPRAVPPPKDPSTSLLAIPRSGFGPWTMLKWRPKRGQHPHGLPPAFADRHRSWDERRDVATHGRDPVNVVLGRDTHDLHIVRSNLAVELGASVREGLGVAQRAAAVSRTTSLCQSLRAS